MDLCIQWIWGARAPCGSRGAHADQLSLTPENTPRPYERFSARDTSQQDLAFSHQQFTKKTWVECNMHVARVRIGDKLSAAIDESPHNSHDTRSSVRMAAGSTLRASRDVWLRMRVAW